MSIMEDPFISKASKGIALDSRAYTLSSTQSLSVDASSPAQAKRTLETYLAETELRLEEASKLGTALIEQQRELSDKLREVERQEDEGQIGPELRRKLVELEKEYNDIGEETSRVFLSSKRHAGAPDEGNPATPYLDQKSPLTSALFAGQATNSPSKVSVPSRKQRNQPSSRVHDIEFATEISTSLLGQVRQLQALLAEREEGLRTVNLEKSRLELEVEGYAQRVHLLNESEQRYKDENWALEAQTHELMATIREATDRENKLNSSLGAVNTEKNTAERELEDLRQLNSKLVEEQLATQKSNDAELHLLRRNLAAGDTEKAVLQQKLSELTSQNQELAKVVAMQLRQHEAEAMREVPQNIETDPQDQPTPESSPPPSPNKFTPRHSHLETETLRSSLGHAHRMIQNLKSTIHREKTEKIELKRMLQEARDEVEQRRRDSGHAVTNKRQKIKLDPFKKQPRPDLLGAGRTGRTEVELHDTDWEDNIGETIPSNLASTKFLRSHAARSPDETGDEYHTATEPNDGFETANELGIITESDVFQTGAESMADDSTDTEELTETENTVRRTSRGAISPFSLPKMRNRVSTQSTASTSTSEDEDEDEYGDWDFPSPTQRHSARYQLKARRSVLKRGRPPGEAPMASVSRPSSARNSPEASFGQEFCPSEGQSLFAELAELEDHEEAEGDLGMSMRPDTSFEMPVSRAFPALDSRRQSEVVIDSFSKPLMVDFGVNTDPWEPIYSIAYSARDPMIHSGPATPKASAVLDTSIAADEERASEIISSTTQCMPHNPAPNLDGNRLSNVLTPSETAWDSRAEAARQTDSASQLVTSSISSLETSPAEPRRPELSMFYAVSSTAEPVQSAPQGQRSMARSPIRGLYTKPLLAIVPKSYPRVHLTTSPMFSEHIKPGDARIMEADRAPTPMPPKITVSSVHSEHTEPMPLRLELGFDAAVDRAVNKSRPAEFRLSPINFVSTEPFSLSPSEHISSQLPKLTVSITSSAETSPAICQPSGTTSIATQVSFGEPKTSVNSCKRALIPAFVIAAESPTAKENLDSQPHAAPDSITMRHNSAEPALTQVEQSVQTVLSSNQIDHVLTNRDLPRPLSPPSSDEVKELGTSPFATPKPIAKAACTVPSSPVAKRPSSAVSQVSDMNNHRPLPSDHRDVVTATAAEQVQPSSTKMGPPLAPASASRANAARRPRTPTGQSAQASSVREASLSTVRRESQASRKSSVSSFASELEERFNMYSSTGHASAGHSGGTDPRIIQAITQTMIGEFLWKYTRKVVSGDISSTRHRRYFWVHPYTRTLYWSDREPQNAGKSELRTKSAPIEAVRVVADDNPYPPGLHCRSLEVVTPGRRIRFTATTSQRHETWFNALSYLLLRESEENSGGQGNNAALEDIEEFNPGFRSRSRSRQTARVSVSSYNSRSHDWPKQRATSAMSVRSGGRASSALSRRSHSSNLQVPETASRRSAVRLSSILSTTIKGSFSSGTGQHTSSHHGGANRSPRGPDCTNGSHLANDKQANDPEGLENVRACCDGQHDVSSLSRKSRHSPIANRLPSQR